LILMFLESLLEFVGKIVVPLFVIRVVNSLPSVSSPTFLRDELSYFRSDISTGVIMSCRYGGRYSKCILNVVCEGVYGSIYIGGIF